MASFQGSVRDLDAVRELLLKNPPDFAAARALLPNPEATTEKHSRLDLEEGETKIVRGNLQVTDLIHLEIDALLWVFGDCRVGGVVYSHDFDYSLLAVGGRLEAGTVRSGGEILALGGLRAGMLWGTYNDYSTYAPTAECEVYIADDRRDIVPSLSARKRIVKRPSPSELRELFGDVPMTSADDIRNHFVKPPQA